MTSPPATPRTDGSGDDVRLLDGLAGGEIFLRVTGGGKNLGILAAPRKPLVHPPYVLRVPHLQFEV